MIDVSSKTAIVTGAASGIGLGIATVLSDALPLPFKPRREGRECEARSAGLERQPSADSRLSGAGSGVSRVRPISGARAHLCPSEKPILV
jgi:NAD(P)-dependent dehydrogenase (short-subunit alcohol dehydrogenase family)